MTLRQKVLRVTAATLIGLTFTNYLLFGYRAKIAPGNLNLFIFVIGLIYTGIVLIFLEKNVLSRLGRCSVQVRDIGASRNFAGRLEISSRSQSDELVSLAREINLMLDELESARAKLQKSEARLRLIADNMQDIVCLIDSKYNIQFISPSVKSFLDYEPEELFCRNILDFIYEPDRPKLQRLYREITAEQPGIREEIRLQHRNSSFLWVEVNGKLLFDGRGLVDNVIIAIRNIEERKEATAQLIYLTMHDPVTGLKNRRFFEAELQRLYQEDDYPISVIAADMDGLSLINDTMGHGWGDRLLKRCANILQKRAGSGGKAFRTGGDEFAIIMTRTGDVEAAGLIDRIQDDVVSYNRGRPGLPLQISLGFAVSRDCSEAISETFQQADDRMYRDKLYRTIKNRDQNTQILLTSLAERDQFKDGHAGRMDALCHKLARQIGLSGKQLKDLSLFAMMHDLGKIGIPKKILFKDGPLTSEEWKLMRSHPEKGYRIACSSPELAPIADLILLHHERWNGSGYPLGLEGEQIPVECRILAIADAYDNMTNARYGTVRSKEEALAELQRCAGTQFDPVLLEIFIKLMAE